MGKYRLASRYHIEIEDHSDYESDGEGQYRSDTYRTYEKLIKTEGFFSSLIR